jgi:hypothetical protein
MRFVQGLFRGLVVAFTVLTLSVVAVVGVSASSGKVGSSNTQIGSSSTQIGASNTEIGASNTLKNSVVALFSGHLDQAGFHAGTTTKGEPPNDGHPGKAACKPSKKHHRHATPDRENAACDDIGDDSGSA